MEKPDPIRPTDDEARTLARQLIDDARFGALAVTDVESGGPSVTRVAIGTDQGGTPVTLISSLSAHWQALAASPQCALLLGEPGPKGDPLVHPRLTVHCTAACIFSFPCLAGTVYPSFSELPTHWFRPGLLWLSP